MINPKIEPSWLEVLRPQFEAPYFAQLKDFLVAERQQYVCYPKGGDIFAAFDHTPFDKVKVVILGQDPYHEPGQAHGLCFSVPEGIAVPPSLVNIIKEINSDLGTQIPLTSGNLTGWAEQGVLLLNATLTVRAQQGRISIEAGNCLQMPQYRRWHSNARALYLCCGGVSPSARHSTLTAAAIMCLLHPIHRLCRRIGGSLDAVIFRNVILSCSSRGRNPLTGQG